MSDAPEYETIRERIDRLSGASPDGMSWFEDLYRAANGDASQIPWSERRPNKNLIGWLERERPRGKGKRALVVGCGLGEDAELLSRWQYDVTAFDLSGTAIEWCKTRYPSTRVTYAVGDLLQPPPQWIGAWDFVFEAYTVQPLPLTIRAKALEAVGRLVAPGGRLLFVTRARDADDAVEGPPPWPLTMDDVRHLGESGALRVASFEDYFDDEEPPVRRFRVVYERDA